MDCAPAVQATDRRSGEAGLTEFVSRSVAAARVVKAPFFHLEFDRVFPERDYADIVAALPEAAEYRPMSGRTRYTREAGSRATRVKIELFPEYIRHLPAEKRPVWTRVGRALCSRELRAELMRKLAPALERRFGPRYARVRLQAMPLLTRDIAGYHIAPHTDTHWKGITVQFYLPADASTTQIGTVFLTRQPDGNLVKHSQMKFAPNTGYAFAVGTDSWHSVETVGPEVKTRDSILLTYVVDAGPLLFLRNRLKRAGNLVRNEWRHRMRR